MAKRQPGVEVARLLGERPVEIGERVDRIVEPEKAAARRLQASAQSGFSCVTRSSNSIASAGSSARASPARLMRRSAVSEPERAKRRSMSAAMPFASPSSVEAASRAKSSSRVEARAGGLAGGGGVPGWVSSGRAGAG